jgi:hypothetical protein
MDSESRRDLQLLEVFEHESAITQRRLSARLGIALGLTNLYVKRLVRKGYVKCVTTSPKRLVYFVTPRGLAVKGRLTYEFMKYSLDFYRDVRRHLRENLLAAGVTGQQRVAVYGTGDVAELVYLLLKEMGIDLVAVYDGDGGGAFLGLPIVPLAEHRQTAFDLLIVAVLEKPAAARKRLLAAGIPAEKLLMLQTKKKA